MASILLPHAECHFLSSRASILIFADKPLFYGAPHGCQETTWKEGEEGKKKSLAFLKRSSTPFVRV